MNVHTNGPVSLWPVELSKINFVELSIINFVKFPMINVVVLSIITPMKLWLMAISVKLLRTRSIVLLTNTGFSVINSIKSLMECLVEVAIEDPLEMLVVEDTGWRTHNPKTTTQATRMHRPSMSLTAMTRCSIVNTLARYNSRKLDPSAGTVLVILHDGD